MKLTFDKGTIQIQGDVRVPNSTWDERSKTYRAMALSIISITSSQRLIALWLSPYFYLYAHDLYDAYRDRHHAHHGAYGASCRTMPNPEPILD
jgi:hypothetical protein